jgi:predicted RNase H-like nuclease
MPKESYPSSFECDCRYQLHFFENTIKEMKLMSKKKKSLLSDGETPEHTIVFEHGFMVDIQCPKRKKNLHKKK